MLVVLRNANAGKRKKALPSKELVKKLGSRGHLIETFSLHELQKASEAVVHADPDLIVLWGGDGTITATISALIKAYQKRPLPPVCLLPGGTMNVVARALNPESDPVAVLESLLKLFYQSAPLPLLRRTLLRHEEQYGFLFGIGLLANFLEALYEGDRAGTFRSAYVLGRACVEALWGGGLIPKLFQPFEAKVTVNGKLWPQTRWVNVSAGGTEALGLGFKPYIRCAEKEGFVHLIGHDLTPMKVLRELPGIHRGLGMKEVQQDITNHFVIEASRPMVYSLEGELYEAKERFEVKSGPTLQLVVPP